jgi:hypothetical protein
VLKFELLKRIKKIHTANKNNEFFLHLAQFQVLETAAIYIYGIHLRHGSQISYVCSAMCERKGQYFAIGQKYHRTLNQEILLYHSQK